MTTKNQVLYLLMEQNKQPLSGEEMAQKLQKSRTAIWKAIQELKKEGHQIQGTAKGYLYSDSDILSVSGIQLALGAISPLTIQLLAASESSMKDAKFAALNGAKTNTLFVAEEQKAPKGRFGRAFFSEKNGGIYMSLLLKPNQKLSEMAQYTLITAVAVTQAIDSLRLVDTQIKWVNDIYLDGKKVCGILSEAISDVETGLISQVVIGIGLNFAIPQTHFPAELQEKATSLFPDGKPTFTRNALIGAIWTQFYTLLALPTADILEKYREKSFVLGKKVSFTQANKFYEGTATQITENGELVVQLPDQTEKILSSGEISLQSIGSSK